MNNTEIKVIPIFDLIEFSKRKGGYLAVDLSYGYDVNQDLLKYLQYDVMPDYLHVMDKSRSIEHILDVTRNSLILAQDMGLDLDTVMTAAVYHDIGTTFDFKNLFGKDYYYESYESLKEDEYTLLELGLTKKKIQLIEIAILEMGLNRKSSPYSTLLADADKLSELNPKYLIKKVSDNIVSMYTYKPVDVLVDAIFETIHKKYGSEKSPGRRFYTPIGRHIRDRKIKDIERIANDKDIFLYEFKKLIDIEMEKDKD